MKTLTYHTVYHAQCGNVQVPDQYAQYYKKGLFESMNAGYMTYSFKPISKSVIDFKGLFESTKPKRYANPHEKVCLCLNSQYSTIAYIREHEKTSFFINEALIETIPTEELLKKVNDEVIQQMPKDLNELTFGDVGSVEANDQLFKTKVAGFMQTEFDRNEDAVAPLFCIWIPVFSKNEPSQESICKDLEILVRKSGYEITAVDLYNVKAQPLSKDVSIMVIEIEARYNDIDVQLQDTLYHVTPLENVKSIVSNGIIPHSNSKEFKYPDRVYLFNKHSIQTVEDYGASKILSNHMSSSRKFCIIQVNGKKIRESDQYKSGKLTFYADVTFTDDTSNDAAVFTYDIIPREFFIDKVLMYELDDSGRMKMKDVKGIRQPDVKVVTLKQAMLMNDSSQNA